MGVWPPVPTVDVFAEALTDAPVRRWSKACLPPTPHRPMPSFSVVLYVHPEGLLVGEIVQLQGNGTSFGMQSI